MPLKRIPEMVAFDEAKMKKVNLFETPRFFCDVYALRPGQEQKAHVHEESDKVYYVVTGSVIFRDGEAEVAGEVGDALWAPAGEEHGVRNPGPGEATLLVFMAPHPKPPEGATAG